jgi:hypothetical protein
MGSPYNPSNRRDNCGFCAIAYALHLQKNIVVDADQLYLQALESLGLARNAGQDPIPRMLIFPEPMLDSAAVRTDYSALSSGVHGLSSYTITSVAQASGLRFQAKIKDLDLPRQFMQCYSNMGPGTWTIRDFEQMRLNFLRSQGRNPTSEGVKRQIAESLGGHSIVGSKVINHFINIHIDVDRSGHIEAFDPQDGSKYDGRGLNSRLRRIDLLMHLL